MSEEYLVLVNKKNKIVEETENALDGTVKNTRYIVEYANDNEIGRYKCPEFEYVQVTDEDTHDYLAEDDSVTFLEKETYEHFLSLQQDLKELGINISLKSAGRTNNDQAQIKKNYPNTAVEAGESEHQLGLCFDIDVSVDEDLYKSKRKEYKLPSLVDYKKLEVYDKISIIRAVKKSFVKHGFIKRYEDDRQDVTKVPGEWWHFRYVTPEYSSEINKKGVSLEEFVYEQKYNKKYIRAKSFKGMYKIIRAKLTPLVLKARRTKRLIQKVINRNNKEQENIDDQDFGL